MIHSIKLQNFKCFKNQEVYLKNLNLLTGINGLGKSSVLQSLLLLRQNFNIGIFNDKENNNDLPDAILNGELTNFGSASDILYQYYEHNKINIDIEFEKKQSLKWLLEVDDKIGDSVKSISLEYNSEVPINERALFSNNFHYLSAERLGPREYYPTSSYQVITKKQLGIRGEFIPYFLFLNENEEIPIKELKHLKEEGNTIIEQVNAWLQEIRPYTKIKPIGNSSMNLSSFRYTFYQEGGDIGKEFRPINVGFGLSYVLSLIVTILSSPKGSLLLFENPEAHLHPKGQTIIGTLIALAASNGIQMIVETHSDHLMDGVRIAVKNKLISADKVKFHYFESVENEIKIITPNLDQNGKLSEWPKGFFDQGLINKAYLAKKD